MGICGFKIKRADVVDPGSSFPTYYLGNPNAYWSSINTNGGIATSRDGEVTDGIITIHTPGFVHVSAREILGVGEIRKTDGTPVSTLYAIPYSDLEFHWDFGDPSSAETFTNVGGNRVNATGATVNSNSDQYGPEAVHCYRTAAASTGTTYTITLTIRAKGGVHLLPIYNTFSITKRIRVKRFEEHPNYAYTRYIDADNGDNTWDGTSPVFVSGTTGPWKTGAPVITNQPDGTIVLKRGVRLALKRGTSTRFTWSRKEVQYLTGANSKQLIRVTSYSMDVDGVTPLFPGVGTKPKVSTSTGLFSWRNGASSTDTLNDVVFGDWDIEVTGYVSATPFFSQNTSPDLGIYRNFYFDNLDYHTTADPADTIGAGIPSDWVKLAGHLRGYGSGYWNSSFRNETFGTETIVRSPGLGFSAYQWHFQVGGYADSKGSNTGMHHIQYTSTHQNFLARWFHVGLGSENAYGCNGNYEWPSGSPHPENTYARYQLWSECLFNGAGFAGIDLGGQTRNLFFADSVVERCRAELIGSILNSSGRGSYLAWYKGALDTTFRDNELWNLNLSHWHEGGASAHPQNQPRADPPYTLADVALGIYKAYRNRCHRKGASGTTTSQMWEISSACQFTDNEFVDLRGSTPRGLLGMWSISSAASAGSIVDRNRYYTPNYGGERLFWEGNIGTARSISHLNTNIGYTTDENAPMNGGATTDAPDWDDVDDDAFPGVFPSTNLAA